MTNHSRPVTRNEYKVSEDQNLLSRTDRNGVITYAAQAFVEVSGYSREELVGSPHSIVRHPDMPARPSPISGKPSSAARSGSVW